MTPLSPRAFSAPFAAAARWGANAFTSLEWHWPPETLVPLGSVLKRRQIEVVEIGDPVDIPIIEKITFGGALSVTEPDARRGYKGRLFWAHMGDFIYSKIRAKQGSFCIVGEPYDRVAVSTEYPVFTVDTAQVEPEYMTLALRSQPFLRHLVGLSHGGSTKTRIAPDEFEEQLIPLPPLPIQQAIVGFWQRAQEQHAAVVEHLTFNERVVADGFLRDIGVEPDQLHLTARRPRCYSLSVSDIDRWGVGYNRWTWTLDTLLASSKYPTRFLGEVAQINPLTQRQFLPEDTVSFVPMEAVSDRTGTITPQTQTYKNVRTGYTVFAENDIIWAKITPCMQNGKSAIARDLINGVGFGSTEFHVVRCDTELATPQYIWSLLRLFYLRQAARRYFIGSAGQQRVPADFLAQLAVPLPPPAVQQEIAEAIQAARLQAEQERAHAATLLATARADVEAMILGTRPVALPNAVT